MQILEIFGFKQPETPKIIEICQLGNPLLRQPAETIKDINNPQIQNLIDGLIATVNQANGVGIAAPQVGQPYRLLIVASHPNSRYPDAPTMEPTVMINPQIISQSSEIVKDWEGCLSIPGIRGLVPRSKTIEIEYTSHDGNLQRQELTNFIARIFQHEYDHLNGIVFLDRVESAQELMTEQEYQLRIVPKL